MLSRKVFLDAKSYVSQQVRQYSVLSRPVLERTYRSSVHTNHILRHNFVHTTSSNDTLTTSKSSSEVILNFQHLITTETANECPTSDHDFNGSNAWSDFTVAADGFDDPQILTDNTLSHSDLFSEEEVLIHNDESDLVSNENTVHIPVPPVQPPHDSIRKRKDRIIKKPQQLSSTVPSMTIYQYKSTEETYFQWDYRYHPKVTEWNVTNMLTKIEKTLKGAHLEPYGKHRGVDTVRNNILNFDVKEKFRLGRNKSLEKGKISVKLTRDGVQPDYKKTRQQMNQLLRPNYLLRSILKVIYERHSIYASGYTEQIAHLDPCCLGESFFGPDTPIRVDYNVSRLMLRELWLHGHSSTFNKLQWNHNTQQEQLKVKNYRPKLTD